MELLAGSGVYLLCLARNSKLRSFEDVEMCKEVEAEISRLGNDSTYIVLLHTTVTKSVIQLT